MNLKNLIGAKKVSDGYSNNSNYFGDWYGRGQIDYSKVINPDEEGELFIVKIWSGSGYVLDVYLVNATDDQDAIDKVFEWSYENEGANNIVFDYEDASEYAKSVWEDDFDYYKEDYESFEDFEDVFIEETYVSNSDYTLFAISDNFFVDRVPNDVIERNKVIDSADNMDTIMCAYKNACDCLYYGYGKSVWDKCGLDNDTAEKVWTLAKYDLASNDTDRRYSTPSDSTYSDLKKLVR